MEVKSLRVGFLERWDRRNQRVLQAHNERARTEPLVKPGGLAIIFADFTLNVAWMSFLIGTILLFEGSSPAKVVGGAFYVGALAALVVGGRHVVSQVREARQQRRRT